MRVAGDEAIVGVTRVVEDDEEDVPSEETEGVTEAPVEASEE